MMEKNQNILQPSLGVCEQHHCSLNAANICMSHMKKVWNQWSVLFHYGWDLRIKEGINFIQIATETLDYIVENIMDEGVRYGVDKDYVDFQDWVRDMRSNVNGLMQIVREYDFDVYNISTYVNKWIKLSKDVFESQPYILILFILLNFIIILFAEFLDRFLIIIYFIITNIIKLYISKMFIYFVSYLIFK